MVTSMGHMFSYCNSLRTLDVSNWNVISVNEIDGVFYNCSNLNSLDLSNWSLSNIGGNDMVLAFYNCSLLTDFKAPKDIRACLYLDTCNSLTHDSLMSIINNLEKVASMDLILGEINLAKLTDEEIAIAVNKNWTVC